MIKILLLFLLSVQNGWAFPATPVLDTFTRANAGTLGVNWTGPSVCDPDNLGITSNAATDSGTSGAGNNWNQASFPSTKFDVYVTITVLPASGDWVDVWAIDSPTDVLCNFNGYVITLVPPNSFTLSVLSAGNGTDIGDFTQNFNAGDSFGMSKRGTLITVWYKAAAGSWTSLGTVVDTTVLGNLYLGLESADNTLRATNFGGGAVGALINNAKINGVKIN